MDECTQESCRKSVCNCPDRNRMLGINALNDEHFKIGDIVTDKNGAQVVVCPEITDDGCYECFYFLKGCDPVTNHNGIIGCADGEFIFKLQEKKC